MVTNLFRYIFCIFWSVIMITSSILLMVLTLNRKLPVIMARTAWSPGILWACGIRLAVHGREHVKPGQPCIFVSNHCSYLDIPVLFRALPANLYFIAKKEIKWVPFIGQYMMATGMLFVNRDNKAKAVASLKKAASLIHNGKCVLMFPEGTRSRDGKTGNFKKGPFHLALQAEVNVVPIMVSGTASVLGAGTWKITPGIVNVHIGEAIESKDFPEMGLLQQEARARLEMLVKKETV